MVIRLSYLLGAELSIEAFRGKIVGMHKSKRQRSLEILREIAEKFGVSVEPKQKPAQTITEQEVIDAGILEPVNDRKETDGPA